MLDIILFLAIAGLLIFICAGTYRRHKFLQGRVAHLVWASLLTLFLVFFLRLKSVELQINQTLFNGLPGAYLLRSLVFTIGIMFYTRILRQVDQRFNHRERWLDWIGYGVLILLPVALALNTQQVISSQQAFYLMILLMDFNALLCLSSLDIEIQLFMYRQEKVPTMRIKHLAGLLLCISYAVTAGLNMLIAPVAIFTGKVMYVVPLAPIAVNCIFIQFLPHRVVLYLLLPEQILIYYRLKSLNNQILNAVGIAKMHSEKVNLFSFKQIETAIYTTLISILDYYPLLAKSADKGKELSEKIDVLVKQCPQYDDLVKAMAHVKYP